MSSPPRPTNIVSPHRISSSFRRGKWTLSSSDRLGRGRNAIANEPSERTLSAFAWPVCLFCQNPWFSGAREPQEERRKIDPERIIPQFPHQFISPPANRGALEVKRCNSRLFIQSHQSEAKPRQGIKSLEFEFNKSFNILLSLCPIP